MTISGIGSAMIARKNQKNEINFESALTPHRRKNAEDIVKIILLIFDTSLQNHRQLFSSFSLLDLLDKIGAFSKF